MTRCMRCGVVLTHMGRFCLPRESRACELRALHNSAKTKRPDPTRIDWQATCVDYVNRLQLLASDPALQKLADEGMDDASAALRKVIALLREGPLGSPTMKR